MKQIIHPHPEKKMYTYYQLIQAAHLGHDFGAATADSVPFDTIEDYLMNRMDLSENIGLKEWNSVKSKMV